MPITVSDRSREYVRKRAQDHMGATVSIFRDATQSFNSTTGIVETPVRTAYYTGIARVWTVDSGQVILAGEADITTANTNVSIPWGSAQPQKDDLVKINSNQADPTVVGKVFRVMNIDGGGLIGGTIRMSCTAFTDSAVWSE